jgi:hypothetical protein
MGRNVLHWVAKTSKSLSLMDRILPSSPVQFHTDLQKPDVFFRNRELMNVAEVGPGFSAMIRSSAMGSGVAPYTPLRFLLREVSHPRRDFPVTLAVRSKGRVILPASPGPAWRSPSTPFAPKSARAQIFFPS